MIPLHGTKTHPLTGHGLAELKRLAKGPVPRQEINPGCANRLLRGKLATVAMLPSPYKTHKGRKLDHLQITTNGQHYLDRQTEALAQLPHRQFPSHLKGALTNHMRASRARK